MKRSAAVLIFSICFLCSYAQKIQVIVPKQVVAGNAFQIQYIVADPSELINISPPLFDNLQLISGPNYYKGNSLVNGKTQAIENITYTLVPAKEGAIKINSLIARLKNGIEEKTDEVMISVLPQPKASFNAFSTYTDINLYAPSSKTDLDKLITANLFIKTEVSKRICFLGDVITATFKLYSRLQSTSELINAPSLYGFSVMDMLDMNEAHQAVETIDGKVFNTSVLRKLQLYPAQTGRLTIDGMQLQNTIEFTDSATGKRTKVEKTLVSVPVDIMVKPLPSKQPGGYTGAVGKFDITAGITSSKIEAGTQGKLTLTISGKGNFIQFASPSIQWPKEFDVFDSVVTDELNTSTAPTGGKRKYIFSFSTDKVGSYIIPPVSFSFFDVTTDKYKEVNTDSLKLEVVASKDNHDHKNEKHQIQSMPKTWIYILLAALLLMIIFILLRKRKKQQNVHSWEINKPNYSQKFKDIISQQLSDKQFCSEIQKLLIDVSKEYNLSDEQKQELKSIQNNCLLMIYSDISLESKRDELEKRTEAFLKQVQH